VGPARKMGGNRYGHVDFASPNPGGIGVFGSAAIELGVPGSYPGRAGVFAGPVEVLGDLTCTGNRVVWGTKSAAARHTDGTHRLLYSKPRAARSARRRAAGRRRPSR
jgi:hypothetical protein